MANVLISDVTLTSIANKIREKLGVSTKYKMSEIPSAIDNLTNTSDANATSADILVDKSGYVNNNKIDGTMPNNGAVVYILDDTNTSYTIPLGYHNGEGTVSVTTVDIPNPTISVNASGLITASASWTKGYTTDNSYSNTKQLTTKSATTYTPNDTEQSIASGTYLTGKQTISPVPTETKSATPTESEQTISPTSGKYLSSVTVNAISSTYVGSGITKNPTPTVDGATVNIPSGYYSADTSKSVASGSLGTVSASKGSVSNNSITVTPSISGCTVGYISDTSKTGSGVTVSASELVSGNKALTPSETAQNNVDVTNYKTVSVSAISSTYVGSGVAQKSSTDLTVSGATVTVPSGYYASEASKSVSSGSAGSPSASKGTVSNHQVTITPSVTNTTGYITGGTKTGTSVTVSASELVSGSQTITSNGTVDVTNLASVNVSLSFQTIHLGTSTPSSSLGSNGDLYIKL